MIMAHGNYEILERLVSALDDRDNLIIVHVDKKAEFSSVNKARLTERIRRSEVIFPKRQKVSWGGSNMIDCELKLLSIATENNCDYCHLLSGVDFPLKSNKEIHAFFEQNKGKEFVNVSRHTFDSEEEDFMETHAKRLSKYHFFQNTVGRNSKNPLKYVKALNDKIQDRLKFINRTAKSKIRFYGGAQWFSITNAFAGYILSQKNWIKKTFRFTSCGDEIFVQTLLCNSEFYDNLFLKDSLADTFRQCQRFMDWKRGKPYTFDISDYDLLINSGYCFCRKVGDDTDSRKLLLDKLEEHIRI